MLTKSDVFHIAFKVVHTFFFKTLGARGSLPAFIDPMQASRPRSQIKNNKSVNWKMKDAQNLP